VAAVPALARRLDTIKLRAGIKGRDLAQLLNTTPETVSRWRTGRAEPQRDRLEQVLTLEWLADQLGEFYPPDEARLWLFSPHRLLAGDRPADRIQGGKIQDVLALIEQMKTGAFV
jgi:transcriptional regulator with XRE-family HTH domain